MSRKTRLLSLLLSIVMILGVLPVSVFADASADVISSCTVTFKDGSSTTRQTVPVGGTVSAPDEPTRSGYRFVGWYTEVTGGEKFDFTTPVTKDITLYSHWSYVDGMFFIPPQVDTVVTAGNNSAVNAPDSDGDGISDDDELNWLNYDPNSKDSDGNGISDSDVKLSRKV